MKAEGTYILAITTEERAKNGIIIGDKNKATVHSIGGAVNLDLQKGDLIWIHKNAGLKFGKYLVLDEQDVIASGDVE
tara:strand:+ start:2600 stop:2830 length:231 start_codon:yes stop_codon:yes gene_type:complete